MSEPNPFAKKSNEQFTDVPTFLRFFSPVILNRVKEKTKNNLLTGFTIFRSPPGFGKSTLFRLFSANVLSILQQVRTQKDSDVDTGTLKALEELQVFGVERPQLIGIMINVAEGYHEIGDIFDREALPIFRAMLNAKIILKLVASLRDYYQLNFSDPLNDFELSVDNNVEWGMLPETDSLQQLYDWARNVEQQIAKGISDLNIADKKHVLHTSYAAMKFLGNLKIQYKGREDISKFLLMIDDAHKLKEEQREDLLKALSVIRPPFPVWVAERLSSLSPEQMLIKDADLGRDYDVLFLDEVFSKDSRTELEKFITNIIDSRMLSTSITGLKSWLAIRNEDFELVLDKALEKLEATMGSRLKSGVYAAWYNKLKPFIEHENKLERVLGIQSLLTRIAKYENRIKSTPLLEESVDNMPNANSAFLKFYVHQKFKIPYYYGFEMLWQLSSQSVFEFLEIAEVFFEEIYAMSLTYRSNQTYISAKKQQTIVKRLAKDKFEKMSTVVVHSKEAQWLLKHFAALALERSIRETEPYVPSVTGFAIDNDALALLLTEPKYELIKDVLTDMRKNNFLLMRPARGNLTVFYLNRLLCAHFGLAFGYGGWNKFSIQDLLGWTRTEPQSGKNGSALSSQGQQDLML